MVLLPVPPSRPLPKKDNNEEVENGFVLAVVACKPCRPCDSDPSTAAAMAVCVALTALAVPSTALLLSGA